MANGTFWRGTDGNVYVAGDSGVNNAGRWDANSSNYWTNKGFSLSSDPVNGGSYASTPSAITGKLANPMSTGFTEIAEIGGGTSAPSGGGGGTARPALNQAGVNLTQASIDQLPGLLESLIGSERQRYQNTENQFNEDPTQGSPATVVDHSYTTPQILGFLRPTL